MTPGYQTAAQSGTGAERGIVHIKFTTASMSGTPTGQLMMMTMTHHRTHLLYPAVSGASGSRVRIDDMRGELVSVLGDEWFLGYDLAAVSAVGVRPPQEQMARGPCPPGLFAVPAVGVSMRMPVPGLFVC